MLTDEQVCEIAHEARTRPPQEAARHLFPLIRHISELAERQCDSCRFWVPYTQSHAPTGECTYPASEGAKVKLPLIQVENEQLIQPMLSPFDWHCKGWQERPKDQNADACQKSV